VIFAKLLQAVEKLDGVPVEVEHLRGLILQLGTQDRIRIKPMQSDPDDLYGIYIRYKQSAGVYADALLVSVVGYCEKLDIPWQRFVCAKELIHILNGDGGRSCTKDEIEDLVVRLVQFAHAPNLSFADFAAMTDKAAEYQAMAALFPLRARAWALSGLADKTLTRDAIIKKTSLPAEVVDLVLSKNWPAMLEHLKAC
jgi:hypothetical protein